MEESHKTHRPHIKVGKDEEKKKLPDSAIVDKLQFKHDIFAHTCHQVSQPEEVDRNDPHNLHRKHIIIIMFVMDPVGVATLCRYAVRFTASSPKASYKTLKLSSLAE